MNWAILCKAKGERPMKNCIRFLSALMALLLACVAGSAELSAPGVLPLSDKTIHFTVGVAKSSVVERSEERR